MRQAVMGAHAGGVVCGQQHWRVGQLPLVQPEPPSIVTLPEELELELDEVVVGLPPVPLDELLELLLDEVLNVQVPLPSHVPPGPHGVPAPAKG
jgi:hypothetical protein